MNVEQVEVRASTASDRTARWRTTEEAAPFLGMSKRVLRDTLAEHARSVENIIEARFDGIIGRRVGRRWKVWLSERWLSPENNARKQEGSAMSLSQESARSINEEACRGST